ncbi:MAG: FAD-dependent monooxygenase [Pseudomonadota bacterium]
MRTLDVPVLIVGAGPTGLLTANLLGTYGVEALVVERNEGLSDHPKAILLDDEGLRALQAAGLAEEISAKVIAGYGARYYAPDGTCFAKVEAPITEHGYARRNAFLQPDLERALLAGLERFQKVSVAFSSNLESFQDLGGGVEASVSTTEGPLTVRAQVLLACDGGRSSVREHLGLAMPGRTDSRDWVVVDTVNDPDGDRFSKFFCDPARPMVSIPAPGGGRRYEYMILPGEDPAALSTRARVRETLSRFRTIPDEDMTRAVVYTFHARVAERLQVGRVLLLGDAAHLSPPFAGQGMNAGLRDAFNVAWKVARFIEGRSSEAILDTYEQERRGPIEEMIDYAVSLGEIVMPVGGFDEAARARILEALVPSGGAMQPKPQAAYTEGWLLPGLGEDQSLLGRPLPQPVVRGAEGEMRLLDDLLGNDFAVIAVGVDAQEIDPAQLAALAPNTLHLQPPDAPQAPNQLLLVRPDRFIAAQIDPGRVGEAVALVATF